MDSDEREERKAYIAIAAIYLFSNSFGIIWNYLIQWSSSATSLTYFSEKNCKLVNPN